MKILSAVLVAVFCATVATGAPSSDANASFPHFFLSKLVDGLEKLFNGGIVDIKCIRGVITNMIDDSEVKAIWEETDAKLDNLINVEWPKCLEINDRPEKQGCQVTVVGKAVQAVTSFLTKLATQLKFGLIREIRDKIKGECFENTTFFDLEDQSGNEQLLLKKAGDNKIKCIVDAISEALKESDYESIWDEAKNELEELHERIKECKNESSHAEVIKCIAKEVKQAHEILKTFSENLKEANKETYDRVKENIKNKCLKKQ